METYKFEVISKNIIIDYFNKHSEITDKVKIGIENVYIVWMCKTLQNTKALLSTTVPDGLYYEVTYNGDKDEIYLDVYKKWENKVIENTEFKTTVEPKIEYTDKFCVTVNTEK